MSLVDKTVKVEQNIDKVLAEVKSVIVLLKSGKPLADIAIGELLKLQTVLNEVVAVPGELSENLPAAIRTIVLDVEDLAVTILGIPQPL